MPVTSWEEIRATGIAVSENLDLENVGIVVNVKPFGVALPCNPINLSSLFFH